MAATDTLKNVVTSSARMAVSQILHRVPTSLWRGLFPKTELGFCYHMVSDVSLPHLRHYPILSPAEFDADLTYLRRYFDFISYEQLVQRRESSNLARDNSVILTFDDGFAECATVAAPILLRHGAGCVFFVVTDLIDNSMVFRESEASLCIDAICRLPVERVETVVRELGLDARLRPPPTRRLFDPTRYPLDIAGLGDQPENPLRPLFHWLLTIGGEPDLDLMRQLCARLGVDPPSYLRQV